MMRNTPEPLLHPVAVDELRPTQLTVGYREVEHKRAQWRERAERDGPEFLGRHMIPVVIGPKNRMHLIDHHHLARALHDEGVKHVLVSIVADLHALDKRAFRTFLDNRNWLHPFDSHGRRQRYNALPKHVAKLEDDPFRSLAGAVRRAGGFAKVDTPYSEFLWADFFRRRIDRHEVEERCDDAVVHACEIAIAEDGSYLPGWAGIDD